MRYRLKQVAATHRRDLLVRFPDRHRRRFRLQAGDTEHAEWVAGIPWRSKNFMPTAPVDFLRPAHESIRTHYSER